MSPSRPFVLALTLCLAASAASAPPAAPTPPALALNGKGYFEMPGLNVMLGSDYYPEGHQGGVGLIQNGRRVATNGDLRLEPAPGQWQPMPKTGPRTVDPAAAEIRVRMSYPDDSQNRTGYNPIDYPDLRFSYTVRVVPAGGSAFRIIVDLDAPLPAAWVGKVGFNLELFPGILFGKSYLLGAQSGMFPRQADGLGAYDSDHMYQTTPLASGPGGLVVAPETDDQRLTIAPVHGGELALIDGRGRHNNGWFVVRAAVAGNATKNALEWVVTPEVVPDWKSAPVVQISQVGYHPKQPKIAVIELDRRDPPLAAVELLRAGPHGLEPVLSRPPEPWGEFLRYHYVRFDFSAVTQPGIYLVRYGSVTSSTFRIDPAVYQRDVWQPTVGTFLPAQMCHMRVNDRYRVWHGLCHADDALMAPVNHNHFDGYKQGPETLTKFQPGEHVPGLDRGGWHDAGDYDVRIESQIDTVHGLALAWELFHPDFDDTTVDENLRVAELHQPDGKPDVLQQIEHGVISVVGGYNSLGRLYRGIQDAALRQYTHLGDAATMTDNLVFHDPTGGRAMQILAEAAIHGSQAEPVIDGLPPLGSAGSADDRWVFTEDNPEHDYSTAGGLAAAARALKGYNDPLAGECRRIALELWAHAKPPKRPLVCFEPAIELYLTTRDPKFLDSVRDLAGQAVAQLEDPGDTGDRTIRVAGHLARALPILPDEGLRTRIRAALREFRGKTVALEKETPYGLPYRPDIWGAGWGVQRFGVEQYFLHAGAPDIFPADDLFNALNFVLGCHPGANPASFVSGVGAVSTTTAYGANRADASYIPGGITSGTALIRPDFPELLQWPFLWQQTEYCLGYSTSDYVFLVLAADHVLNE